MMKEGGNEDKEYGVLSCNDMYLRKTLMFPRNIRSSSSGAKSKLSKKRAQFAASWFLVWLNFDAEDGGDHC
jgi:hypothetical protein